MDKISKIYVTGDNNITLQDINNSEVNINVTDLVAIKKLFDEFGAKQEEFEESLNVYTLQQDASISGLVTQLLSNLEKIKQIENKKDADDKKNVTHIENSKNIVTGTVNAKNVFIGDTFVKFISDKWIYLLLAVCTLVACFSHKKEIAHFFRYDKAFNKNNKKFKILLLPFNNVCVINGKSYDVGFVLFSRLSEIKDSLNIALYYLNEFDISKNFNQDDAKKIMAYHNADQIIYGKYFSEECAHGAAEACFNYLTAEKWSLGKYQTDISNTTSKGTARDVLNGQGQHKIDYIIYFIAGIADYQADKYQAAIEKLSYIKDNLRITTPEVSFTIGTCFNLMENHEQAIKNFKQTIKFQPNHKNAIYNLACSYQALGNYDMAVEQFRKVVHLDSTDYEAYNNMGLSYFHQKEYEKAINTFNKGIKINPKYFPLWYNMGNVNYDIKNYQKAYFLYKKVIEIIPDEPDALFNIGCLFGLQKQKDSALFYWKKVFSLNNKEKYIKSFVEDKDLNWLLEDTLFQNLIK